MGSTVKMFPVFEQVDESANGFNCENGLTVKIFLVFEQGDEDEDDGFWSQKGSKTELHG